jgi:glutathione synthase/RimK-type ligase-like ATP-grasp enzyme
MPDEQSVLILSSPKDPHSKVVAGHLDQLGLAVAYWRPQNLLTETSLTCQISEKGVKLALCFTDEHNGQKSLSLNALKSIWLRRPGVIRAKPMPEPWIERFVVNESSCALESIFQLIPCSWINHPIRQQEAMLKLRQLELARQCGLAIPKTIVTNDASKVSEFYDAHKGKIVYKLIDSRSGQFFPIYELPRSIPTMPFQISDLKHIEQVNSCLHLFQERIDKVSDLRVTVIGQKVFAAQIESQAQGEILDWRMYEDFPTKKYQLPKPVEQSCLNLMKMLQLSFGAFDFCKDKDGHYIFLEVNPDGQFLWIEEATAMPMSYELAKLLAGQEAN